MAALDLYPEDRAYDEDERQRVTVLSRAESDTIVTVRADHTGRVYMTDLSLLFTLDPDLW